MEKRAARRRIVMPDGELKRFRLPAEVEAGAEPHRRTRWRRPFLLLLWALFSVLCWQLSLGHWGPRAWRDDLVRRFRAVPPASTVKSVPRGPRLATRSLPTEGKPSERTPSAVASRLERPALPVNTPPSGLGAHGGALLREASSEAQRRDILQRLPSTTSGWKEREMETNATGGAHWFPPGRIESGAKGCQAALERYGENAPPGKHKRADELVLRLERKVQYERCKLQPPTAVSICAVIQGGAAKGVTVYSEPPSAYVSGCIASIVASTSFVKLSSLQMVRTELFWR